MKPSRLIFLLQGFCLSITYQIHNKNHLTPLTIITSIYGTNLYFAGIESNY